MVISTYSYIHPRCYYIRCCAPGLKQLLLRQNLLADMSPIVHMASAPGMQCYSICFNHSCHKLHNNCHVVGLEEVVLYDNSISQVQSTLVVQQHVYSDLQLLVA